MNQTAHTARHTAIPSFSASKHSGPYLISQACYTDWREFRVIWTLALNLRDRGAGFVEEKP